MLGMFWEARIGQDQLENPKLPPRIRDNYTTKSKNIHQKLYLNVHQISILIAFIQKKDTMKKNRQDTARTNIIH